MGIKVSFSVKGAKWSGSFKGGEVKISETDGAVGSFGGFLMGIARSFMAAAGDDEGPTHPPTDEEYWSGFDEFEAKLAANTVVAPPGSDEELDDAQAAADAPPPPFDKAASENGDAPATHG